MQINISRSYFRDFPQWYKRFLTPFRWRRPCGTGSWWMTLNPFGRGLQRKWRRTNTKHSTRPSPGWVDLCFTHKESTLMILFGFLDQFKWNHFSFSGHWWALVSDSLHRWRRSHLQVNPLHPCICTQRPFRWVWNQEKWLHQGNLWDSH